MVCWERNWGEGETLNDEERMELAKEETVFSQEWQRYTHRLGWAKVKAFFMAFLMR